MEGTQAGKKGIFPACVNSAGALVPAVVGVSLIEHQPPGQWAGSVVRSVKETS